MRDDQKSKAELIAELQSLRAQVTEKTPSSCAEPHTAEYHRFLDGLPQAIYELDMEMRLTYANKRTLELFGVPRPEDVIGKTLSDFIHPDDLKRAGSNAIKSLNGVKPHNQEYRAIRSDGHTFPMRVFSQGVFKDGTPVGLRGAIIDLTTLKETEQALQQSATHYRTLFEHTGTAMTIFGEDAIISQVNTQFSILSGYSADEVEQKKSWMDFIRPEKIRQAGDCDDLNPMATSKMPCTYQSPFITRDGTEKQVQIFIQMVPGSKDRICSLIDITEAVKAEKALRESETFYRTLFGSTGTAMAIVDKDSIIKSCNPQFEAIVDMAKKDIEGKRTWFSFIAPEDLERVRGYHERRTLGDTDTPGDYEFICIASNDVRKHIHVFIQLIPGTEDRICSMLDITDRKRTEKALRASDARYELVVKGANDGLWDWDLETNEVYFSPRYKEMLGYTDDEFPNVAESWTNNVHPDDLEHTIAANMECVDGKVDLFEVEYRLRHKDGTYRWIHGRGTGAKDVNGKVYRMAGTHTDITERKVHEQTTNALYAISKAVSTTQDLQELYGQIHSSLGEVIDANNFFISLHLPEEDKITLTYVRDEVDSYGVIENISDPNTSSPTVEIIRTGKSLFISSAAPENAKKWKRIGMIGTMPKAWVGVPLKIKDKIIGTMTVQHYSDPHRYNDADVALLEAVSGQVALAIERKANEEALTHLNEELESKVEKRTEELENKAAELEKANRRLKELDKIKSGLVSSISHELRTPLTSIRGFAKLTGKDFAKHFLPLANSSRQEKKGRRIRANLEIIESEGERLTRLINDFLDINKIESGKTVWNDTFLNPCAIVRQAVNAQSGTIADNPDVSLVTNLPKSVPPIHADPDKIQQVISNLLNNAFKFTNKGSVSVELKSHLDSITITVSDTGKGIPESELEKVFDKFHKHNSGDTVNAHDQGTGLGLAICREIVEHYGGSIWVHSTVGTGSEFSFSLPAIPGSTTACED